MKSDLVDITAILRHETSSAYLLFDGHIETKNNKEVEVRVWVPKSQVEDNQDGTWAMPEWLALEKGFI